MICNGGGTERTSEGTESLRRVEEQLTGTKATASVRERLQGKERRSRPPLTHPLSVAGQVASKLRLGFCTFIYVQGGFFNFSPLNLAKSQA